MQFGCGSMTSDMDFLIGGGDTLLFRHAIHHPLSTHIYEEQNEADSELDSYGSASGLLANLDEGVAEQPFQPIRTGSVLSLRVDRCVLAGRFEEAFGVSCLVLSFFRASLCWVTFCLFSRSLSFFRTNEFPISSIWPLRN